MSWRLAKLQGFVEGCHDKLQAHRLFQKSDHRGKAGDNPSKVLCGHLGGPRRTRDPDFLQGSGYFPRGRQAHIVQGASILPDAFVMCMATSKRRAGVMWRSGQEVGVELEKPTRKPEARSAPAREPVAPASDASNKLFPTEAIDLGGQASGDQPPAVANAAAGNEGDQLNIALTRLRQRLEKMKKC